MIAGFDPPQATLPEKPPVKPRQKEAWALGVTGTPLSLGDARAVLPSDRAAPLTAVAIEPFHAFAQCAVRRGSQRKGPTGLAGEFIAGTENVRLPRRPATLTAIGVDRGGDLHF